MSMLEYISCPKYIINYTFFFFVTLLTLSLLYGIPFNSSLNSKLKFMFPITALKSPSL